MPSVIAAVSPNRLAGPNSSSGMSAISTVSEVITVRASVSLTDRSSSSGSGIFLNFFRFSRMRS